MPAALSPEVLRHVRRIEITARRLVSDLFAGSYSSTFKGRGMEFAEVREYFPGDDVRSIDWNVTARLGHPFVKKFIEERELTVMFLVDVSGSLGFGSRGQFKSERAAEITALLALSALRNNDKAGLMLFSDRVEKYVPPRKSRGHVLRLVREVLSHAPQGRGTSIKTALDTLSRVQRRRAVVFLISDFMDAGYERALRIARGRHDVIAVPLRDPWENRWPAGVRLLVEDAETGRPVSVPAAAAGGAIDRHNGQRRDRLARDLRRSGTDAVFAETGSFEAKAFLKFFHERAKRQH